PCVTGAAERAVRSHDSPTAGWPLLAERTTPGVCARTGTSVWIAQTISARVGAGLAGATPLSTQALRLPYEISLLPSSGSMMTHQVASLSPASAGNVTRPRPSQMTTTASG